MQASSRREILVKSFLAIISVHSDLQIDKYSLLSACFVLKQRKVDWSSLTHTTGVRTEMKSTLHPNMSEGDSQPSLPSNLAGCMLNPDGNMLWSKRMPWTGKPKWEPYIPATISHILPSSVKYHSLGATQEISYESLIFFVSHALHLKHICYDPTNTMHCSHARDPTTTTEMRNRGIHSGACELETWRCVCLSASLTAWETEDLCLLCSCQFFWKKLEKVLIWHWAF